MNDVYLGMHGDPETQRKTRSRVDWICGHIEGESVLDLGCSQGIVSILLARGGRRCLGLDVEAGRIDDARAALAREPEEVRARVEFRKADGARLDLETDSYDAAVLGEVIEHLEHPGAVLSEVRRVVKGGGRVVITTPFGHLPHPDHRQTFGLGNFLDLVLPEFDLVSCEILDDGIIGFVGTARAARDASAHIDPAELASLLRTSEDTLLRREVRVGARNSELRERLHSASEKYRVLSASLDGLKGLAKRRAGGLEGGLETLTALVDRSIAAMTSLTIEFEPPASGGPEGARARRLGEAKREVERLRKELLRIRSSPEWPWLRRYWRLKEELVRAPWATRKRFVKELAGRVREGVSRVRGEPARAVDHATDALDKWLDQVAADTRSRQVVFMYSGTTFIQDRRGNRPIRMARVLEARGIPVLFAYWRWRTTEAIPEQTTPGTLQIPIDVALKSMARIARHPLGGKERIFVATFPHDGAVRWVNTFNAAGWTTVYDCRDEWEEFAKVGQAKWWREDLERYLVENCDVTTCTASTLQEKMATYGPGRDVRLSPNALDPAFVLPESRGRLAPRSGPPVIGYWGHLTDAWFDWGILEEVARKEPGWRFEIIGHPEPKRELPENVAYLGSKPPEEINRLVTHWRAAFIAFEVGPLSAAVDPIKIYEYLALGLPTATLTMPQIHDYPYVFHAEDAEGLRKAMAHAMEVPMDRKVIDAFLAGNRWEDRVDTLVGLAGAARGRDPLKQVAAPLRAAGGQSR